MNQSPLHHKLKALGAKFRETEGWDLPQNFGSAETEWKAVRTNLGILDLAHRGKIIVKGNDRVTFLHNLLSNDIKNLKPGAACYATLLTPKGKIISDMNIFAFENFHILELDEKNVPKVIEKLSSYVLSDDVEIQDGCNFFGLLSIQGQATEEFLKRFPKEPFEYWIFKNDRTGSGGADFWTPIEKLEKLWDNLQAIEKIPAVGSLALDTLRIEAGIPVFGVELDENTIPNEAGLERAISWTKGCYPGQEVVARIKYRGGVQRILSGIILKENLLPGPGDKLFKDASPAGTLTSTAFSYQIQRPIGLAYLQTPSAHPGTLLQIKHGNNLFNAEVRSLPFIGS